MEVETLPEPGDPSLAAAAPHPDVERVMAQRERFQPVSLPTMVHGFATMLSKTEDVERAHDAVADVGADLRTAFGRDGGASRPRPTSPTGDASARRTGR